MAFLEVNQVKKSFGQGDTRVEVLRGIDLGAVSPLFSISSAGSMARTAAVSP